MRGQHPCCRLLTGMEERICSGLSEKDKHTLRTLMRTVAENSHGSMQNQEIFPDADE